MGDVQLQSQQEPFAPNSPIPLKQSQELIGNSTADHSPADTTDHLSNLCLHNGCHHRLQPPCAAATNSTKRRSPFSLSSGEPNAKKLFCDQENLSLHGFSAVPLPLSLGTLIDKHRSSPVLRRCVSDPYKSPENSVTLPRRGPGLPPLPTSLKRCVSDVTPSQTKALSHSSASEETTPDSMRLKKMKERLKEIRQWWDEVIKDVEEEEAAEENDKEECAVAEDDMALPSQDELSTESEEAVSVEWAEKCVSLTFGCPCGKGYEVLLSENSCYYKLV